MSSNQRLYIILGLIALVIGLIVVATFEYRMVSDADWDKRTYTYDSKDPYGMWLFRQLTEQYYPDAEHYDGTPTAGGGHSLYIRSADRGSVTVEHMDSLVQFVAAGNDALIIANTFSGGLDTLYSDYAYHNQVWGTRNIVFTMAQIATDTFAFAEYDNELEKSKYYGMQKGFYADDEVVKIDYNEVQEAADHKQVEYHEDLTSIVQFYDTEASAIIRVSYGNNGGYFYLCSTPAIFSNIGLQQVDMVHLYDQLMPTLQQPAAIYWDDSPGVYIRNVHSESPLKYILSQRSLRLAYYLLLGLGLLYMLFRSRRRQRAIRLVDENKNTSLDYIDTLSRLYRQDEDHHKLVQHIEKLFYHRVEQSYYVSKDHPDFVTALAKKARDTEENIEKLMTRFDSARKGEHCTTYQLQKLTERVDNILDTNQKTTIR